MITLPLTQPTIMIQFLITLGSLSHKNPPLNIDLPLTLILLISYNIIFSPSHPHNIDFKVYKPHKNKITNKRCVCNNVQKMAHAYRATVWRDVRIFKVNMGKTKLRCHNFGRLESLFKVFF
jgi:hypothetical protein